MPIYEYRCEACGHHGEHLQKVSDAPLTKCPECGKAKYRKQLSAAGFQLKGTGWYATDFRSGAKKEEKKTETKKEEKKTETKGEEKSADKKSSDSKPESKAAA